MTCATDRGVLSNAALHHLPDARTALRRLSRLLRPGGTLPAHLDTPSHRPADDLTPPGLE